MRLIGKKIDNAIKRRILVWLRMVIKTTYIEINLNSKIFVIEVKRKIILMINLC